MNKFLDAIIHSYKKPEMAFHFCGSETINYNVLDVFNQKEENWKMLFTRSLLKRDKNYLSGIRSQLRNTHKFSISHEWINKNCPKRFYVTDIKIPYDDTWIEVKDNNNEFLSGFHIKKTYNSQVPKDNDFLYMITPYIPTSYIKEFSYIGTRKNPIKVIAPMYSFLFSNKMSLIDLKLKPKGIDQTDRFLWGKHDLDLKNLQINDHIRIVSSDFGSKWDNFTHLDILANDKTQFTVSDTAHSWLAILEQREADEKIKPFEINDKDKSIDIIANKIEYKLNQIQEELFNLNIKYLRGIIKNLFILLSAMSNEKTVKEINNSKGSKRHNSNKQNYYEFKTLTINPNVVNKYINTPINIDHHKNRFHSVRGHLRTYKNGRKVWIKNYDRGNEELGIIKKEYLVKN